MVTDFLKHPLTLTLLCLIFFVLGIRGEGVYGNKSLHSLSKVAIKEDCSTCHSSQDVEILLADKQCSICHSGGLPYPKSPQLGSIPRIQPVSNPRVKKVEGMMMIPEGPFMMGYDERHPDEGPAHHVTLPTFFIDPFEVTNKQYKAFIEKTKRPVPDYWQNGVFPQGAGDHPVSFVTWYDARDYCEWKGKRLPSEKEWEKAARGTDGRLFPWGNTFDPKKANTPQSRIGRTTPVGQFPEGKSPYGLFDMGGNVWEWTDSWAVPYPGNPRPKAHYYTGGYKVLRGGSWVDCSFYRCGISAFTFNRGYFKPDTKNKGFGFRCAKSK